MKKESSLPCVAPPRAFTSFLHAFLGEAGVRGEG